MSDVTLPTGLNHYQTQAQRNLSPELAAYFLGGAGDENSLNANTAAFDKHVIVPRHLRDNSAGSTRTNLLGRQYDTPILVAPFAYQKLLHTDGEIATAQGCEAQSVPMVLSAQSTSDLRDVRQAAPQMDWFQLYWLGSRTATLELANRAISAGYGTLVFTIDAPVQGVRDREIASGFALPAGIGPINLAGIEQPQFTPMNDGDSIIFDRIATISPTWDDIAWLCQTVPVPVLLKGVLHPDDAVLAQDCGAAGVIVSNHGGRVLDRAIASLDALPQVVAAVGPDYTVLFDGGIRRGVDVLTALALGAHSVLIGRLAVCGLAVAGAMGVSHVLRLLRDELEIAMLLAGCRRVQDITPEVLYLKR